VLIGTLRGDTAEAAQVDKSTPSRQRNEGTVQSTHQQKRSSGSSSSRLLPMFRSQQHVLRRFLMFLGRLQHPGDAGIAAGMECVVRRTGPQGALSVGFLACKECMLQAPVLPQDLRRDTVWCCLVQVSVMYRFRGSQSASPDLAAGD
jgi:hypothetical protein